MDYQEIIDFTNNQDGYIKHNNMEIISLNSNECKMKAKVDKNSLNPNGTVHGGLLFGICDTVCGSLAYTTGKKLVTLNSTIDYLRPVFDGEILATSKCIKLGKTIGVYEANLYNNEKLVARSTITIYFTDK